MQSIPSNPLTSFWLDPNEWEDINQFDYLKDTVLTNDKRFDATIIGAGLTGLSTAYWLIKENVIEPSSILILDRRGISKGATGRNGGHCWPSLYLPDDENDKEGDDIDEIRKINEWIVNSVDEFISFINDNNVDCDLVCTGAINAFRFNEEEDDGKHYIDTLNDHQMNFLNDLSILSHNQTKEYIQSNYIIGGNYQSKAYQFWPAKVVYFLTQFVLSKGVTIKTQSNVIKVDLNNDYYDIHFEDNNSSNRTVSSKHVIYATNAYTSTIIPSFKDIIVPTRGQIIATKPLPILSKVSISMNDGSEYLIQRKDGRIIYGGMRWRSKTKEVHCLDDSSLHSDISEALRESLNDLFHINSNDYQISHEWTGIMGYVKDKYPCIGRIRMNEWIAAGYTGNGMPKCFGAGKMIANLIKDGGEYYFKRFNPLRFEKLIS